MNNGEGCLFIDLKLLLGEREKTKGGEGSEEKDKKGEIGEGKGMSKGKLIY